jgi:hypothetical protein
MMTMESQASSAAKPAEQTAEAEDITMTSESQASSAAKPASSAVKPADDTGSSSEMQIMAADNEALSEAPMQQSQGIPVLQGQVPIIEVAFKNGMWWQMPLELSQSIMNEHMTTNNSIVAFIWEWGDTRRGSWQGPEGEGSTINRYTLDFDSWEQTNSDNQRKRSFRVAWVSSAHINPISTGSISR